MSNITDKWVTAGVPPLSVTQVWISAYYMIFSLSSDDENPKYYVFDYDQVMMICDTLSARTFTLWYNGLLPDHTPGKIQESVLLRTYKV